MINVYLKLENEVEISGPIDEVKQLFADHIKAMCEADAAVGVTTASDEILPYLWELQRIYRRSGKFAFPTAKDVVRIADPSVC